MTTENVSMEKCWDYLNPPKPEEEIPGSWVTCVIVQKVKISVAILTDLNLLP